MFNGLRLVSYLPQIVRIARDRNGASAISYSTWLLWTAANAATGLYAWVNLNDWSLAGMNAANAACCGTVIALTIASRRRWLVAHSIGRGMDRGRESKDVHDSDCDLIATGDRTFPEETQAFFGLG
ncbi:PQ-loop repeat-containing protein [Bradyrhizobium prioriisuperbiae]|uniref:PQ-loop repeat-containing protein n=1 Tax=Bradyrhizobium prioriisuperbiae TaxID=2854389 RepID=UPI0028F0DA97|nr:PQ-loop repeat-containing protein [Bradyrhizobium prioritasuperba]